MKNLKKEDQSIFLRRSRISNKYVLSTSVALGGSGHGISIISKSSSKKDYEEPNSLLPKDVHFVIKVSIGGNPIELWDTTDEE